MPWMKALKSISDFLANLPHKSFASFLYWLPPAAGDLEFKSNAMDRAMEEKLLAVFCAWKLFWHGKRPIIYWSMPKHMHWHTHTHVYTCIYRSYVWWYIYIYMFIFIFTINHYIHCAYLYNPRPRPITPPPAPPNALTLFTTIAIYIPFVAAAKPPRDCNLIS